MESHLRHKPGFGTTYLVSQEPSYFSRLTRTTFLPLGATDSYLSLGRQTVTMPRYPARISHTTIQDLTALDRLVCINPAFRPSPYTSHAALGSSSRIFHRYLNHVEAFCRHWPILLDSHWEALGA